MTAGFFIEISNGLLKGGHKKRMGSAVWEFMWLLDRITKVDTNGTGYVLGGKPINLSDIAEDLETHENTISINLKKLKDEGYIAINNTGHGLIIKVAKAKKRFNKKLDSDSTKTVKQNSENSDSLYMTLTKDNTVDSNTYKYVLGENAKNGDSDAYKERVDKQIDQIIKAFEDNVGQIPSDKKPRHVAQNIKQIINTFVRDNGEVYESLRGQDLTFDYVLNKAWEWYAKKKYCEETEKLETFKLKMKVFLDSTSKNLAKERSMHEEIRA